MSNGLSNTLAVDRPSPRHFSFSQPYSDATREKRLLLQYCRRSGQYQFFRRPVSIFTARRDLEWREVSGRGKLFAWTIAHIARLPFAGHTPFIVVTVTLEEGVYVIANLINCPLDEIAEGMAVRATWVQLPDGTHLLLFEPDFTKGA